MKQWRVFLAAYLLFCLASGCGKPSSVTTIKSPTEGVYYTVEISKAGGLASDTTRVYAHFQQHAKTKKILILEGDDITVAKIIWNGPHDATLCLDGGFTNTFRNEVTLIAGDAPEDSFAIHNRIDEHCDSTSTTSSKTTIR